MVWLAVDILLTFATVVLSFFEMTAGAAVRYSWAVTHAQWPRCALYVLAAPLALHMTFVVFPARDMPEALYLTVSLVITTIALACKGATVAVLRRPLLHRVPPDGGTPPPGEVTAG